MKKREKRGVVDIAEYHPRTSEKGFVPRKTYNNARRCSVQTNCRLIDMLLYILVIGEQKGRGDSPELALSVADHKTV